MAKAKLDVESKDPRRDPTRATYRWTSFGEVLRSVGLPLALGERLMGQVVGEIVRRCWEGERVRVPGLGILEVTSRAARRVVNPATGVLMALPRSRYLVLRHGRAGSPGRRE